MLRKRKIEPIKDINTIRQIEQELLKNRHGSRDHLLFKSFLNLGLRVTDILNLKVKDVSESSSVSHSEILFDSKKIRINKEMQELFENYIFEMNLSENDYLFYSPHQNKDRLERTSAFKIIQKAAENVGLERLSGHALRKTFGYFAYQNGVPLNVLSEIFNHANVYVTKRYIGLDTQEDINEVYDKVGEEVNKKN
ncbi:tyrosine-type recombinase/integrase [Alkalibacillus aidingensis]|uniref:tyrosine-type recombinase/integrase n=1 Tax=Alkalibacillus aidingensis TaxID=2747607 RepID=UPI001660A13E|nr:tyrosine-type recombinase/integrase [Alkalibacillus aidingensis]